MIPSKPRPERERAGGEFKGRPSITLSKKHDSFSAEKIDDTETCAKHGEFKVYTSEQKLGKKYLVKISCSDCVKEADAYRLECEALENEWNDYEIFTSNLERAGVTKRGMQKTFDSYNADSDKKKLALSKFKSFSEKITSGTQAGNLIVCGSVGTGKTHLAYSVVIESVKAKRRARITTLIDMIRHIKSSWEKDSQETEESILCRYQSVHLLVLDEIGVQFGSDTEKMFIFDVINGRYENMLPTILISNLNIDGVKEVLGERVIDRLREDGGQVVVMDWESNRGK